MCIRDRDIGRSLVTKSEVFEEKELRRKDRFYSAIIDIYKAVLKEYPD